MHVEIEIEVISFLDSPCNHLSQSALTIILPFCLILRTSKWPLNSRYATFRAVISPPNCSPKLAQPLPEALSSPLPLLPSLLQLLMQFDTSQILETEPNCPDFKIFKCYFQWFHYISFNDIFATIFCVLHSPMVLYLLFIRSEFWRTKLLCIKKHICCNIFNASINYYELLLKLTKNVFILYRLNETITNCTALAFDIICHFHSLR